MGALANSGVHFALLRLPAEPSCSQAWSLFGLLAAQSDKRALGVARPHFLAGYLPTKSTCTLKVGYGWLKWTDISGILGPHGYGIIVRSVTSREILIEMRCYPNFLFPPYEGGHYEARQAVDSNCLCDGDGS
jgi:hypothetical protein